MMPGSAPAPSTEKQSSDRTPLLTSGNMESGRSSYLLTSGGAMQSMRSKDVEEEESRARASVLSASIPLRLRRCSCTGNFDRLQLRTLLVFHCYLLQRFLVADGLFSFAVNLILCLL